MLRIYYANVQALDEAGEYPLSAYRAERLSKIKLAQKRRESFGVELVLNQAARELMPRIALPLDIVCGEYGKPALRGGELKFSLSHSGGLAAAAVSDMVLGLDIQEERPCNMTLAKRFFAADEIAALEWSEDKDAYFTELWCRKESCVKAWGRGLPAGLNSFSVIGMTDIWHGVVDGVHFAVCVPGRQGLCPDMIKKVEPL